MSLSTPRSSPTLRFRITLSAVASALGVLILLLGGCDNFFVSRMESPLDEGSVHYPGYDTVGTADELRVFESPETTWIVLTASRVLDAREYQLQISPATDFATVVVDEDSFQENQMEVSLGLTAGSYQWRARARQTEEWGRWSAGAALTVLDPFGGLAPAGEEVVASNTPTLTWQELPDAKRYEVQFAAAASDLDTAEVHTAVAPPFVIPTPQPVGPYRWRVAAISGGGARTAWSAPAEFSIQTGDTTPPGAVGNLSAVGNAGSIGLTWDDPEDADLARIRLTWTPTDGGAQPVVVPVGTQAATITGLTAGTSYTVSVVAEDASGNAASAVSVSATPTDDEAPGEVGSLAHTAGNGQVTLTWQDPADADLAAVRLSWQPDDGEAQPKEVLPGTETATITGLDSGTIYLVTVRTVDDSGNVSDGISIHAKPGDTVPPAEVTNLVASAGVNRITLTWDDPADADLDRLRISWNPADGGAQPVWVAAGTQTATLIGLTAGTTYTVTVRSEDAGGNLSFGTVATATVPVLEQRYRLPVTILSSAIDGNLTDFTVVITDEMAAVLSAVDGPLDADGTRPSINGGGDVRFSADELGTQRLAVDVREWVTNNNPASGSLEVAVKVPTISAMSDTTIYLWWGKAGETQPAPGDPFGQFAAYDAGAWLASADGGASDRTGQRTMYASATPPAQIAGLIGEAAQVTVADRFYQTAAAIPTYPVTMSMMARADVDGGRPMLTFSRTDTSINSLFCGLDPERNPIAAVYNNTDGFQSFSGGTPPAVGEWAVISAVFASATDRRLYRNGVQVSSATASLDYPIALNRFSVGRLERTTSNSYTGGSYDEIRLATVARSAAWIRAESTNLLTPASLFSFGGIESP
jgi:hypothetical protein